MGSGLLYTCLCVCVCVCVCVRMFGSISFHRESSADLGILKISSPFLLFFLHVLSPLLHPNPFPGQSYYSPFVKKSQDHPADPKKGTTSLSFFLSFFLSLFLSFFIVTKTDRTVVSLLIVKATANKKPRRNH